MGKLALSGPANLAAGDFLLHRFDADFRLNKKPKHPPPIRRIAPERASKRLACVGGRLLISRCLNPACAEVHKG
jgi:hypothetical protein